MFVAPRLQLALGLALLLPLHLAQAAPAEYLGKTVVVTKSDGSSRSFHVDRHLGSGYWSHAYEGHELNSSGARVVMKLMKSEHGTTPDSYDHETQLLEKVSHTAIPRAHGVGATPEGRRAMVMEEAHGSAIGAPFASWTPRAPGKSVRMTMQLLRAVRALEAAGVRHNDIHPGNIVMNAEQSATVTLIDVGNARPASEGSQGGNGFYTAPRHGSANDDVYSAATILIHTLTGKASLEAIGEISDPGLRGVMQKATHADPAQRYQHAQELIDALRPYSTGT